jgi:hypothetical protein
MSMRSSILLPISILALAGLVAQGCSSNSTAKDGGTGAGADASDASVATGVNIAELCPTAPGPRLTNSPAMTATDFCTLFLQVCSGADSPADGGFTSETDCEAAYTDLLYQTTRECRSYHVCNAAAYVPSSAALHCGHAVGILLCEDTPPASGQ